MRDSAELAEPNSGVPSMNLLDATAAYLNLLSVEVDRDQLLRGVAVLEGEFHWGVLRRAVERIGYQVIENTRRDLSQNNLPFCAVLNGERFAIVLKREGDEWCILDITCQFTQKDGSGSFRRINENELFEVWNGRSFHLAPSLSLLQEKYSVAEKKQHWFWGRIFIHKSRLFDVVISSLFANLLAVVTSLFSLQVYDRVIPGQSEATLWVLAGGVAIAILFEALLRVSRARLVDQMGKDAERDISKDIFSRMLGMRLDRRPVAPGAIVHMVREFGAVKEFFTAAAVGVVADLPFMIVFLLLIFCIAGHVVWVIVAGATLTIIPSLLLQRRMSQISKESMGGVSSASRVLTEAAYNLETVKVTRSEPFFQKQWEEIIALNAAKTSEQRALSAFLTYWATSMQQATYVFAIIAGVYMVFASQFSIGAIIAVSILSTRTLSPITQLSQVLSRWQNMKTALSGLDTIIRSEQERGEGRQYIRRSLFSGQIEVRNLVYDHPGATTKGLRVEVLKVKAGTRLAIMGSSGAGKSTLLRILAGLYHPDEGEVAIDGMAIPQIDPDDLRRNIGYLPQEIRLHRGTLRENLSCDGRFLNDERLFEALEFGGLSSFIRHHPEGLDARIADGGEGLSIGQRQSIGLARLHLLNPSIVLLDEPTAALDQKLENELVERLDQWIGNRTCIVATHRPCILSKMHQIGIMQAGELVVCGDRDAVLKRLKGNTSDAKKPGEKSV